MLTEANLHWVAGFLEGEGHFCTANKSPSVTAAQVQREPLERLQAILGGSIYSCGVRAQHPNRKPYFTWTLYGPKAAGLMMTLWTLMSPRRREQIEKSLAIWRDAPGKNPRREICKRGHRYEVTGRMNGRGHRICSACAQISWKAWKHKRKKATTSAAFAHPET